MAEGLPVFPNFDVGDSATAAVRWDKWTKRLRNLILAMGVTNRNRQLALLLHYAGEDIQTVYDDEIADDEKRPADDTISSMDLAITLIRAYLNPKQNLEYQTYLFRQKKQDKDCSLYDYYLQLKALANTCQFADTEKELKTQIIQGCASSKLRRKGLTEPDCSLKALVDFGKAMDTANDQLKSIEHPCEKQVNYVSKRRGNSKPTRQQQQHQQRCTYCGKAGPHQRKADCPAFGKKCYKCERFNHFASQCKSKQSESGQQLKKPQYSQKPPRKYVHNTEVTELCGNDEDSDDNGYVYTVHDKEEHTPVFELKVNGSPMRFMADSGASVNIMSESDYNDMPSKTPLRTTQAKVFAYGHDPLKVIGTFTATVESKSRTAEIEFHVVTGGGKSLLSWNTSQMLALLKIVQAMEKTEQNDTPKIVDEYSDLFNGLGKLKGYQVRLHIDESVPPVAQSSRRVPFHVRKDLEEQIRKDEESGVIEKPTGPTPWVSNVVVVPKKDTGRVRVCVDMRQANKAILRVRHIQPTVNEIIHDLNGATVFSKLDLNQGYNQLELAPESRYITTFTTHLGLRQFTRLSFGVSSAAEIFQNAISEALSGINGVLNISDDILVYGKTQKEHDDSLEKTFQRLREKGLTLNRRKCKLNKHQLEFFGHVFSEKGISADPKKVKAIVQMERPQNATEVRSLLGMMNFCGSRFVPNYASLTHDMRILTQKETTWEWTDKHDRCLSELRSALSSSPVLEYFDQDKETEIHVDASPVGLAAILSQRSSDNGQRHIVTYASKSLTPVQQRYSQTEREALAVLWACEHLHLYVFGKSVTIYTDHKPLVAMYGNPSAKLPTRIENWALRLQPYDVTVKYRAGSDNPADYLSRHPIPEEASSQEKSTESHVNYVCEKATPKAMTLSEIQTATTQDPTLQAVMTAVRYGNWMIARQQPNVVDSDFSALYKVKDDLTVAKDNTVLLKGQCIVMPKYLQARAVQLAHEGHQGIVRTKALIREKTWFHGIDKLVESTVKDCLPCQVSTTVPAREPLKMSPLPEAPWSEVSTDFGHLENGEYLLVVTDEYSRYVVVEIITSTAARVVIPKLDKIFSEFGIPKILKSDNGPPFNSSEFRAFASELGFKHRKITPYWPRANAETERFMRTIKKTIKTAMVEQKNWRKAINIFVRNYITTPHSTTGVPPCSAFFGRMITTKLPHVTNSCQDIKLAARDKLMKQKMKAYADAKRYVKTPDIDIGDKVIVKQIMKAKSSLPYDPTPLEVTAKKGSMITAKNGERAITRNSSFFKKVSDDIEITEEEEEEENDDILPPTVRQQPPDEPATTTPTSSPIGHATPSPPVCIYRPAREKRLPIKFKDYHMD